MDYYLSNLPVSEKSDDFAGFDELLVIRVAQELEATLFSTPRYTRMQVNQKKYGGKIGELVSGLGSEYCSFIERVSFEPDEDEDSLLIRFKSRKDIRLNIYFDEIDELIFDNEKGSKSPMPNEDEAYLSYLSNKQRQVAFGTMKRIVEELREILSDGIPSPFAAQIRL